MRCLGVISFRGDSYGNHSRVFMWTASKYGCTCAMGDLFATIHDLFVENILVGDRHNNREDKHG